MSATYRRFGLTRLARVAALSGLTLAGLWASATDYGSLTGYKAAAVFSANPAKPYIAHGEQNKLAAATAAQRACVAANPAQDPLTGYCELVRLGDLELTTASDIKAAVLWSPVRMPFTAVLRAGRFHRQVYRPARRGSASHRFRS